MTTKTATIDETEPLELSETALRILPTHQKECLDEVRRFESVAEYNALVRAVETQAANFAKMPKLYATDGKPNSQRKVLLHYFFGGCDWWLLERSEDGAELYGYCKIHEAEFGYVTLRELTTTRVNPVYGIELDFHWKPQTLSRVIHALAE